MYYAYLPYRGVIRVSGEDTIPFLQGLVTNDVTRVKNGEAVYAALLTPQGKFLHDFFVVPEGDTILIEVDMARIEELVKRLSMYKLRSKVTIAPGDKKVTAVWGSEAESHKPEAGIFKDPRLPQLGYRVVGDVDTTRMMKATPGEYEAHRLSLGIPDGERDLIPEKSLLLEFGIDQLHGVDFSKGCYVGQEVTARTKYRATLRKFIYKVQADDGLLPEPGTPVLIEDKEAGQMRSSAGNMGLALLSVEQVETARKTHKNFHSGTVLLTASLPTWVTKPPQALTVEE